MLKHIEKHTHNIRKENVNNHAQVLLSVAIKVFENGDLGENKRMNYNQFNKSRSLNTVWTNQPDQPVCSSCVCWWPAREHRASTCFCRSTLSFSCCLLLSSQVCKAKSSFFLVFRETLKEVASGVDRKIDHRINSQYHSIFELFHVLSSCSQMSEKHQATLVVQHS